MAAADGGDHEFVLGVAEGELAESSDGLAHDDKRDSGGGDGIGAALQPFGSAVDSSVIGQGIEGTASVVGALGIASKYVDLIHDRIGFCCVHNLNVLFM